MEGPHVGPGLLSGLRSDAPAHSGRVIASSLRSAGLLLPPPVSPMPGLGKRALRMGQHGVGVGTGINSELCCEMLGASLIPLSHSFLVCKTKRAVPASQDYDRSMSAFTYLKHSAW